MCEYRHVLRPLLFLMLIGSLPTASCAAVTSTPTAHADPCADVYVVFARGTGAAPGLSRVGQAFVNSLGSKVGTKTVQTYAVDYPGSLDFGKSSEIGASDATAKIESMVASCPNTKIVLGGVSQGANVIDLIIGGPAAWGLSTPLPATVADHVAAVVVFGNPGRKAGGAITDNNPLYGAKALDLCAENDPICSDGFSLTAHGSYPDSGAADQAAEFVANRLG